MGWILTDADFNLVLGANIEATKISIADAGGYFDSTEVENALQEIGVRARTAKPPNGFEDKTNSTLSWDNGTRTLTLTPTGTDYYWVDGYRQSYATPFTKQIDDTSGIWVFYFDDATPTTLSAINAPDHDAVDDIILNCCIVAIVYWNATDNTAYILADERHGTRMSAETHHYLHDTQGAKIAEGGAISAYTLSTATDAAISFDLTDIRMYDEDLEFLIEDGVASNQYEQVLTGDAEVPVLYRDDVDGSWKEQAASALPYIINGTPQPTYNNDDGDGTWSQVELSNNKFMLYFLLATNDWQYPVKMVQGQAEYATQSAARSAINTEISNWSNLPTVEWSVMYAFVMQQSAGNTKELVIKEILDYRFQNIVGTQASQAVDHGQTVGLLDDDHTQYILVDGTRSFTGTVSIEYGDLYVKGADGSSGLIYLYADRGDDNADKWRISAGKGGEYWIGSYATGAWVDIFMLNSPGLMILGDTANANMTIGLTINQGAADNEILAFKSSDVAHGVTSQAETDTYAFFRKNEAAGCLRIQGFATNETGIILIPVSVNDNTTKSSAGKSPLRINVVKKSGTSIGAVGADANLVNIENNGSTVWIVDEDGDTWQSGGATFGNNLLLSHANSPTITITDTTTPVSVVMGTHLDGSGYFGTTTNHKVALWQNGNPVLEIAATTYTATFTGAVQTSQVMATGAPGLSLTDDASNLGIKIADGGEPQGRTANPIPEVVQSASEPGTMHPGMIWIDTDADGGQCSTILLDADGDTKVDVEESADEDIVRIDAGGSEVMNIQQDGITMPLQPMVHASFGSAMSNLSVATHTLEFDTEVEDRGSDFNTTTYTFTAPVSGTYHISFGAYVNDADTVAVWHYWRIITSNRTYYQVFSPNHLLDVDQDYTMSWGVLADMDASDTVYLQFEPSGGTAQSDILNNAATFLHIALMG